MREEHHEGHWDGPPVPYQAQLKNKFEHYYNLFRNRLPNGESDLEALFYTIGWFGGWLNDLHYKTNELKTFLYTPTLFLTEV